MTVKVTEHRASSIYCNVIKKILLTHIHRLVKIENESENAANFENGNDDKEYVYVYESDDKDEIRSEASRKSEDENEDDDKDMKEDDEDSDDDMSCVHTNHVSVFLSEVVLKDSRCSES